jgi:hypothetical protein
MAWAATSSKRELRIQHIGQKLRVYEVCVDVIEASEVELDGQCDSVSIETDEADLRHARTLIYETRNKLFSPFVADTNKCMLSV